MRGDAPRLAATSPGDGTGRHRGLKSPCPSGRVGSNPTPGTLRRGAPVARRPAAAVRCFARSRGYLTTTIAFMNGWKAQWYANVPAVVKLTDFDLPGLIACVSKERASAVAVWAVEADFLQVIRPPFLTAITPGLNLKDLMSTFAALTAGGAADGHGVVAL